MIAGVQTWFAGLTPRERSLVAVAGGLAAAIELVFGIVQPLGRAHDAAHVRHRAAVEASSRLLAQVAALEAPASRQTTLAGPVSQVVAASADSAGFVLQSPAVTRPRGEYILLIAPFPPASPPTPPARPSPRSRCARHDRWRANLVRWADPA